MVTGKRTGRNQGDDERMTDEENIINTVNGLRYVHRPYLEKDYYDSEEGVIYMTTKSFNNLKKSIQRWNK